MTGGTKWDICLEEILNVNMFKQDFDSIVFVRWNLGTKTLKTRYINLLPW